MQREEYLLSITEYGNCQMQIYAIMTTTITILLILNLYQDVNKCLYVCFTEEKSVMYHNLLFIEGLNPCSVTVKPGI